MITQGWDGPSRHRLLAALTMQRANFRTARLLRRIRTPRRLIATALAIGFFVLYLANGIFVFYNREPANPEHLRLWLSGGMVLYALYHAIRCAWAKSIGDLELTAAEQLWLAGAPLQRSSLAVYHLSNLLLASLLKTFLITVLLMRDADHWLLLAVGIFVSLVLLENLRIVFERIAAGLDERRRRFARAVTAAMGCGLVLQMLCYLAASTPLGAPPMAYLLNTFRGLGEVAATPMVQSLATPWRAAAGLAVTKQVSWETLLQLSLSLGAIPLSIAAVVASDRWSRSSQQRRDRKRLSQGDYLTPGQLLEENLDAAGQLMDHKAFDRLPECVNGIAVLAARQWCNVQRYAGTVFFSFAIPAVLSLTPLLTGQVQQQWLFVVGGVAFYTLLLAPPALKIDFRRDLKRIVLLRSLPITPLSMVVGQLSLPVGITLLFQATVITCAAFVVAPGIDQIVLWTGILAALAVFAFAIENALFLTYPHHEHSEGVSMMIRAKLTFLGKGCLIAAALGVLVGWSLICRSFIPAAWFTEVFVMGSIAATWTVALSTVVVTAWCWKRFELADDIPPE